MINLLRKLPLNWLIKILFRYVERTKYSDKRSGVGFSLDQYHFCYFFHTIAFREVNGPHPNTAGAATAGATPPGATAAGATASSNASTSSPHTRQSQRQTPTRPPGPAAQSDSNTPAGIKTETICVLFLYTNTIF